jgi:hypothetical protein
VIVLHHDIADSRHGADDSALIVEVLWLLDELTVFAAVLVRVLTPLISGWIYLRLLARPPGGENESPLENGTIRPLTSFIVGCAVLGGTLPL